MRERLGEPGRVSSLRIAADGPLRRSELDDAACTPAWHLVAHRGGSSSCSKRPQPPSRLGAANARSAVPSRDSARPRPPARPDAAHTCAAACPVTARPALFRLVATSCDVAHKKATS